MILEQNIVTETQLPRSCGRYELLDVIGRGSFGLIFRGHDRVNNQDVAIKMISRRFLEETHNFAAVEQEIRVHQSLNHPNIVKLYNVIYDPTNIYIVLEFCANGDLFTLMQNNMHPNIRVKNMMYQLAEAIEYLHQRKISHLDIKPENILVDSEYNIKLCDFGCCHLVNHHNQVKLGTLYYIAPELLVGNPIDTRTADVWSFGIVVFVMFAKTLPWKDGTDKDIAQQIIEGKLNFPPCFPLEISKIVRHCCKVDITERVTIKEILQDPFISTIPKQTYSYKLTKSSFTGGNFNNRKTLEIRSKISASSFRVMMNSVRPEPKSLRLVHHKKL